MYDMIPPTYNVTIPTYKMTLFYILYGTFPTYIVKFFSNEISYTYNITFPHREHDIPIHTIKYP